jgi:hypothetical protein
MRSRRERCRCLAFFATRLARQVSAPKLAARWFSTLLVEQTLTTASTPREPAGSLGMPDAARSGVRLIRNYVGSKNCLGIASICATSEAMAVQPAALPQERLRTTRLSAPNETNSTLRVDDRRHVSVSDGTVSSAKSPLRTSRSLTPSTTTPTTEASGGDCRRRGCRNRAPRYWARIGHGSGVINYSKTGLADPKVFVTRQFNK